MKFGFLISSKRIKSGGISIAPLPEFGEIIRNFYETASVSNGWIYGPEREEPKSAEGKESV
jgi:hypothetical protein